MKLLLNNKFIGLLIAINTVIAVLLCFDNFPFIQMLTYFDDIITIVFICEISYKMFYYKKKYFVNIWNLLDAIIIIISFVPIVLQLFSIETIAILGNILILRTFRLFKLFRTVKIIPGLEKIISDFKKAMKVTYGMILGGLLLLIIFGVILCCIFKEFDPVNFGDPLVSIYSVFRLFSVEGWYEIPDAMCERTTYINATLIRACFSFIVLLGIFMLGFIISSMSDELTMDNNDELKKKTEDLEKKLDRLNEKIDLLISRNKTI